MSHQGLGSEMCETDWPRHSRPLILIELRICWDEADQAIEEMFLGRSDLPALTDIQKIIDIHEN